MLLARACEEEEGRKCTLEARGDRQSRQVPVEDGQVGACDGERSEEMCPRWGLVCNVKRQEGNNGPWQQVEERIDAVAGRGDEGCCSMQVVHEAP